MLAMLVMTIAIFFIVSAYQNNTLVRVVGETQTAQQRAISETSEETIQELISDTLINTAVLQANIADNDFDEIVHDTLMLQSMAQGLIAGRKNLQPAPFNLPDPALDGVLSAMVLAEEGVDYNKAELIGIIAHMTD